MSTFRTSASARETGPVAGAAGGESTPGPAPTRRAPASADPAPYGVRAPGPPAPRPARRARLLIARVDPWSVMKLAFLLSLALGVLTLTAVTLLWATLESLGVFDAVTRTAAEVTQGTGGGVDLSRYVALSRVLGVTGILAVVNVALITALATLGAFLYNLAAGLVGGLQVTLAEDL